MSFLVTSVIPQLREGLKWRLTKTNTKKSGAKNVGKVFLITVPQVTKQNVWRKLTNVRSTHQIQVNVVKTSEGHMGLFQTSQAPVDLNCPLCGFAATNPSK